MPLSKILDSHIHLWPATATSEQNHAWMTPGHFLAKRHGVADYLAVAQPRSAEFGFVYVETDRYLPAPTPGIGLGAEGDGDEDEMERGLRKWAKEPLDEIRFLRRIVEGTSEEGDGVNGADGGMMRGCVLWAPFHLSPHVFKIYLRIAEITAGSVLWGKVVGFRYLLQGMDAPQIKQLVQSESWLTNIASLGSRFAFDVGVDVHRDGVENLEIVGRMVESIRVREAGRGEGRVRFVLSKYGEGREMGWDGSANERADHMCKPNLSQVPEERWVEALEMLGRDDGVYVKLSGALNEFDDDTPSGVDEIVQAVSRSYPIPHRIFPLSPTSPTPPY
jgi:L-rhamnono-1,4-lactonase